MENYTYSSYPDSGDSSPRSREIDCENASWDEPPNYKVKFMCSYGGKIQPRPHDNQLAYVGGDTKILAVDRNIRFSTIVSKLSSLCDAEVCFKYQLPGEDLDALISVTNDEDLEHMMIEYDRLHRASPKPARLRLFLFPLNPPPPTSFTTSEPITERQWFVDALNSAQIHSVDESSPPSLPAKENNPDFLFGLDKKLAPSADKSQESSPESAVQEVSPPEIPAVVNSGREDRHPADIQRQIQDFQRMQITNHEQAMFRRKSDEDLARAFNGDYYVQKIAEKTVPTPSPAPLPPAYWRERHMATVGYPPAPAAGSATGSEQPVYLIQGPAGVYQTPTLPPLTGQVGQNYYAMQRMVPDGYREQPVYSVGPPPPQPQKMGMGAYAEGVGLVRPPATGGVAVAEAGFAQVGYDSAGRQVYYSPPGGVMPQYQNVNVGNFEVTGTLNQEGTVAKPSQAPV